jgi:hypothetical protein
MSWDLLISIIRDKLYDIFELLLLYGARVSEVIPYITKDENLLEIFIEHGSVEDLEDFRGQEGGYDPDEYEDSDEYIIDDSDEY